MRRHHADGRPADAKREAISKDIYAAFAAALARVAKQLHQTKRAGLVPVPSM
jgi:ribosome-associated translation inhibitor RaiA